MLGYGVGTRMQLRRDTHRTDTDPAYDNAACWPYINTDAESLTVQEQITSGTRHSYRMYVCMYVRGAVHGA